MDRKPDSSAAARRGLRRGPEAGATAEGANTEGTGSNKAGTKKFRAGLGARSELAIEDRTELAPAGPAVEEAEPPAGPRT